MTKTALLLLAALSTGASAQALAFDALPKAPKPPNTVNHVNSNWSNASQFQLDRAVKTPVCTATRIAWNWAITALHCKPKKNDVMHFYDGGPTYANRKARVTEVIHRPGAKSDDTYDNNGDLADIALLRLQSESASSTSENAMLGPSAVLAWKYPGDGVQGQKVGAGEHDDNVNPAGVLRQVNDTTDDDDDSGGYFVTTLDNLDHGDSGGPFYVDKRIVGILKNQNWDAGDGNYNKYTSVPHHLDWILGKIGYRWRGLSSIVGTKYMGKVLETMYGSELRCQYACDKTQKCEAYNWNITSHACQLVDDVSSVASKASVRGALQYAASSGNSNEVVGYVRGDGFNVVVHETKGRVHELYLQGGWKAGDISSDAPEVAGRISAYVRSDGINAVVYRSKTDRIIELALVGGKWKWYDLSNAGGGKPAGDPVAYVRTDGISAVVYRGTDKKIHELRLASRGWEEANLTTAAGSAAEASSDPHAFRRSDGYSSVVFRSGTKIHELYLKSGDGWKIGNLSNATENGTAPAAESRPFGYTHADGTNAIVYRSAADHIVELWLASDGWRWGELNASVVVGDPMAYVRADGMESVLTRASSHLVLEIANAPWKVFNLSSAVGITTAGSTDPAAFVRTDGYNSVLYGTANDHVRELFWRRGDKQWSTGDISAVAGENL